MKRVLLILLSLILTFSQVAAAQMPDNQTLIDRYLSDNLDMERVYKYDFYEKMSDSEEDAANTLKYANAANIVLALDLMQTDDEGKFNENEFVSYTEFANIIMKLTTGEIKGLSEQYNSYPATRLATQHEAAYYLVGALGYGIYDSRYAGENPRSTCAQRIKLLRDIQFSGEKNITRGELAQMIYNAFQIDLIEQSAIGNNFGEFETTEGNTLLKQRFDAKLIFGVVTAQNGFDMYPSGALEDNQIKINNAVYGAEEEILKDDYLGHCIVALARENTNTDLYDVISINFDQKDTTVCISETNIESVSTDTLRYIVGDTEKRLGFNSINRIIVNGAPKTASQLVSLINSGFEGELRLCSENGKGSINAIIAYDYENFKVNNVSLMSENISFADQRTYRESRYIKTGKGIALSIYQDGVKISVSDLKPGMVLSVAGNPDNTAYKLVASTRVVQGTVSTIGDNEIWIGNKVYSVSKAYEQSRSLNPSLSVIKLGATGNFLLDSGNRIVGFSQTDNIYSYALMTEIYESAGRRSPKEIRVYTTDNMWETYSLEDRLTLDGVSGMSKDDAFEEMKKNETYICGKLIRYRLSSNDKIKFLDTIVQNDVEVSDSESLKLGPLWEDEFNWTAASNRIVLPGTPYSVTKDAKVFTIPSNLEDEEDGFSVSTPTFREETKGKLWLYNVDDYGFSELVVSVNDTVYSDFDNLYSYAVVLGKRVYINDDGSEELGLKVFEGTNPPYWVERTIKVDESILEDVNNLEKGDIILMDVSGNRVINFKKKFSGDVLMQDGENQQGTERRELLGSVVDSNSERRLVKLQFGEEIFNCTVANLGLYETDTGYCAPMEFGDIQQGDRVFFVAGGSLYARILIIR